MRPDIRAAAPPPAIKTSAVRYWRQGRRSFAATRCLLDNFRRQRLLTAGAQDVLGELLLGRLHDQFLGWIGDESLQKSDALDQFGDALQGEEEKADRDQQSRRPDDEAACVGRDLLARIRLD